MDAQTVRNMTIGNASQSAIEKTERPRLSSQYNGNTSCRGLVETELVRERLYKQLLSSIKSWLFHHQARPTWSDKRVSHLLLRYIFNKKATISRPIPDPVFVIGTCPIARRQLSRDLEIEQVNGATQLIELIDDQLVLAALEMCTAEIEMDELILLSRSMGGKLIYRGRVQTDFSRLAQRYGPDYYSAAYALGLRYSYMRLCGHGLARAYKDETKLSPSYPLVCECFASAFNHYFDRYYSAFPDLEAFFGSRGCFFKANWQKEPSGMIYYVCPPFDESLIKLCVDRVFDVLKHHLVSRAHFIFTIPGRWTDFKALEQLKTCRWTIKITDYPKGQLPFIDYMVKKGCQIIYPTDICEIVLTNSIR
jgi:hypothetical protein